VLRFPVLSYASPLPRAEPKSITYGPGRSRVRRWKARGSNTENGQLSEWRIVLLYAGPRTDMHTSCLRLTSIPPSSPTRRFEGLTSPWVMSAPCTALIAAQDRFSTLTMASIPARRVRGQRQRSTQSPGQA
jgi:hypothetical protein